MQLKDALADYLEKAKHGIAERYQWRLPADLPNGIQLHAGTLLSQNLELRSVLHKRLLTTPSESFAIQEWYVRHWGGVKGNKSETLREYDADSDEKLISRGVAGVASWSKMLALRDPSRYAIYDARVAMALNSIQRLAGVSEPMLFPQLPSRNVRVNAAQRKIKLLNIFTLKKPGAAFYREYLHMLEASSRHVNGLDLQTAEMILFADAEKLATQAWLDDVS